MTRLRAAPLFQKRRALLNSTFQRVTATFGVAQSSKFKIKAECFILGALREGRTAQWGCDRGGHSLEMGHELSIQETTSRCEPNVS